MTAAPVPIVGTVHHYDWGDPRFIPELVGAEPDGRPWAELWLGTHPNGPTTTSSGIDLRELSGDLPYLLKVLAADRPLSLQVHPTTEQAIGGFARGVYPDDRAKPELLCALTRFDALCGLRPTEATLDLCERIGVTSLARSLREHGAAETIVGLYRGMVDAAPVIEACASSRGPEAELVTRLASMYPGDPSVAVTLLLNRVVLEPGEAIHLTAGNLHAYLHGAGIELMGASDNVVRGGLTTKPVDVDELLAIVDPTPLAQPVMAPVDGVYPLPEAHCALVRLERGDERTSAGHELLVDLDGNSAYLPAGATWVATSTTFVATPVTSGV